MNLWLHVLLCRLLPLSLLSFLSLFTLHAQPLGSVNGRTLDSVEFSRRLNDAVGQDNSYVPAGSIDVATIRQEIWNQMVEEMLLEQGAEKLGIRFSDEQLHEMILKNPPDYLQHEFIDTNGLFDERLFRRFMDDPPGVLAEYGSSPERIEEVMEELASIRRRHRRDVLYRAVIDAVAPVPLPSTAEALAAYRRNNTSLDGRFAMLGADIISDDDVAVTEEDGRDYFRAHLKEYQQPATREILYAVFPPVPSAEDSSEVKDRLTAARNAYTATASAEERAMMLEEWTGTFGYGTWGGSELISLSEFSPDIQTRLMNAQAGQVIGPVWMYDGAHLIHLDEVDTEGEPSVRVQHIFLLKSGDGDDTEVKATAKKIMQRLKSGEKFEKMVDEYSTDYGSVEQGGDLGYIRQGTMDEAFEKASFGARKGSIVGPVESEYGYHIIKINDRTTKQFRLRDWKIVPQAGDKAREHIRSRAVEMRNSLMAGASIQMLEAPDAMIHTSGPVRRNQPIEGLLSLNRFAFTGRLGETSDVLELHDGSLVVAQISDIRTEGPMDFSDVEDEIAMKLRTERKLDHLAERAGKLRAQATSPASLDALPSFDPDVQVHEFSALYSSSSIPGVGSDSLLEAAIFNQQVGALSPLIRGVYGYYIVVLTDSRIPADEEFETERDYYIEHMRADRQNALFLEWLARQREEAEIMEISSDWK